MIDHITLGVGDFDAFAPLLPRRARAARPSALIEVSAEQSGADAFAGVGAERPLFWLAKIEAVRRVAEIG